MQNKLNLVDPHCHKNAQTLGCEGRSRYPRDPVTRKAAWNHPTRPIMAIDIRHVQEPMEANEKCF